MKLQNEFLEKIRSIKLCLIAHPDNEQGSEFEDRINDLIEIEKTLKNLPSKEEILLDALNTFGNFTSVEQEFNQNQIEVIYEAMNQVLHIAPVVGRSEQFCECDGVQDLIAGTGECRKRGGQCTY